MKFFIVFLATMFCTATALASGISFDGKKVTEPHQVLHLTNEQIMELCDKGQLTLTDEQHAKLLKKSPNFPKTIFTVISCYLNDCTCLIGYPYAILLPGGESVAIENSQFFYIKEYPKHVPASKEEAKMSSDSMLFFLFNYREQLAKRGIVLPPFKWNFSVYQGSPSSGKITNKERYGFDALDNALLVAPTDKNLKTIWISFEGTSATTIENEIRIWLEKNLPGEFPSFFCFLAAAAKQFHW